MGVAWGGRAADTERLCLYLGSDLGLCVLK